MKKLSVPVIVTGVIFSWLLLSMIFPAFSVTVGYRAFDNIFLLLSEIVSNLWLKLWGSLVLVKNHQLVVNHSVISGFVPETLYKKWVLGIFTAIILTKSNFRLKMLFLFVLFSAELVLVSIHIAVGSHIAASNTKINIFPSASYTLGIVTMITIILFWYRLNKEEILNFLMKFNIPSSLLERKIILLFVILYINIIVGSLFLEAFDYQGWINILFGSASKILSAFGYHAVVENKYLFGAFGSLYMEKYCLGIKTMLLFASFIYITGNDFKNRLLFILTGLIFLNFVNIMRFVFLFIHIQRHGGYVLGIDLHDMYNFITYSIVFLLWVIWFEKFVFKKSVS